MSLFLILALVVLTVGQLYLGQNHSAGKMVTDTTLVCVCTCMCVCTLLKTYIIPFLLIIYSWNDEYCQFDLWIMQLLGAHWHLWWNGTVVNGRRKNGTKRRKQPACLVKSNFRGSHVVYLRCVFEWNLTAFIGTPSPAWVQSTGLHQQSGLGILN